MNKDKVNHLESAYNGVGQRIQKYAIIAAGLLVIALIVYNIATHGIPTV